MVHETGLARNSDPETSHEAAENVDTSWLESLVVDILKKSGPMTSEQVAENLKMPLVSISPRFRPLVNKGAIMDTGEKRKNRSGRSAIVWKTTNVEN